MSSAHAFRLIAQIINALHALHEAGIVHRDLKPANVFIVATDQEAYRVKLIDFGIVHDRNAVAARPQMTKQGSRGRLDRHLNFNSRRDYAASQRSLVFGDAREIANRRPLDDTT